MADPFTPSITLIFVKSLFSFSFLPFETQGDGLRRVARRIHRSSRWVHHPCPPITPTSSMRRLASSSPRSTATPSTTPSARRYSTPSSTSSRRYLPAPLPGPPPGASVFLRVESPDPDTGTVEIPGRCPDMKSLPSRSRTSQQGSTSSHFDGHAARHAKRLRAHVSRSPSAGSSQAPAA